jgi:hypothetical protein
VSSLQPSAHAGSLVADFSALKMEAIYSSETSVETRSTGRHITEDGILLIIGLFEDRFWGPGTWYPDVLMLQANVVNLISTSYCYTLLFYAVGALSWERDIHVWPLMYPLTFAWTEWVAEKFSP